MKNSSKLNVVFLSAAAFFAGIVNGFLGTGGGIILVFALGRLTKLAPRDMFATVIAVILPLSALSLGFYSGELDVKLASPYLLPGILGGVTGAYLLDKLDVKLVKKLFAVMVIWAGICFLR